MSTDFADTTARFTYLTPAEVADLDHPGLPTAAGRAGLALGDEGAIVLGTPSELRTWLHAALSAALAVVPEDGDGPYWICIDREHHRDLALGPYTDRDQADHDLEDGDAVNALCEADALDAYLLLHGEPTPDRLRLHPDGTPHDPVLPTHTNDLGDWCPYSGRAAATDTGCPQGCAATDPH